MAFGRRTIFHNYHVHAWERHKFMQQDIHSSGSTRHEHVPAQQCQCCCRYLFMSFSFRRRRYLAELGLNFNNQRRFFLLFFPGRKLVAMQYMQ